ncbi:MAG: alanine--glyoxylate aminotransferase family protein [Anaerolineae bacterium]|nr:alanine--glyoxylate aminotransferase family protein [Anaerolineae bacterium]
MRTYSIGLVPGPTRVPQAVRQAYLTDYGSADLEPEFFELYQATEAALGQILKTQHRMAMMTGEGMVALWGALKSCLRPGDRILAVGNGPYGVGIGKLAEGITGQLHTVRFDFDQPLDLGQVEAAIVEYRPHMVTAVHCDTPVGNLNPIQAIGELVRRYHVPLFYVDTVSAAAGAPLDVDGWGIDLALVGTQKCLSCLPDLAIVTVSPRAWEMAHQVNYAGYDALAPWDGFVERRYTPYTLSWHGIAALHTACQLILSEGLDHVIQRHAEVAQYCRQRVRSLGLELYQCDEAVMSPTVTAVKVPRGLTWETLDGRLRERGVVLGGSWDDLSGHVFRIGHMGSQADRGLVQAGLDALAAAL